MDEPGRVQRRVHPQVPARPLDLLVVLQDAVLGHPVLEPRRDGVQRVAERAPGRDHPGDRPGGEVAVAGDLRRDPGQGVQRRLPEQHVQLVVPAGVVGVAGVQEVDTGGLRDLDPGPEPGVPEVPVEHPGDVDDLRVPVRRALLVVLPGPVPLGLVDGAQVVETDPLRLEPRGDRGQEGGEVVVAVGREVRRAAAVAPGLSVPGQLHGRAVDEPDDRLHAVLPCGAQEPLLAGLAAPVVAAIVLEEALGPTPRPGDPARLPLLGAARADVEPPDREPDAQRLSIGVDVGAEQELGNGLPLRVGPEPHVLEGPRVGRAEAPERLGLVAPVERDLQGRVGGRVDAGRGLAPPGRPIRSRGGAPQPEQHRDEGEPGQPASAGVGA